MLYVISQFKINDLNKINVSEHMLSIMFQDSGWLLTDFLPCCVREYIYWFIPIHEGAMCKFLTEQSLQCAD